MKKYFVFPMILCANILMAQSSVNPGKDSLSRCFISKPVIGFSLGLNLSEFLQGNVIGQGEPVAIGKGIRMGIYMHKPINRYLSLDPHAELMMNNSRMFVSEDDRMIDVPVCPANIAFTSHFTWVVATGMWNPVIQVGPTMRIPVFSEELSDTRYGFKSDVAADFGFGFERKCGDIIIHPSVRYSRGLSSISDNPLMKNLFHHQFAFTIALRG